jgi:hypothetical protein
MTSRCGPCGLWQALGLSEPKARLAASDDGLRTVWHAQLAEDVIDVIPNRLRAQAQPVRNLHVVKSRCDEVEDLALTFGELESTAPAESIVPNGAAGIQRSRRSIGATLLDARGECGFGFRAGRTPLPGLRPRAGGPPRRVFARPRASASQESDRQLSGRGPKHRSHRSWRAILLRPPVMLSGAEFRQTRATARACYPELSREHLTERGILFPPTELDQLQHRLCFFDDSRRCIAFQYSCVGEIMGRESARSVRDLQFARTALARHISWDQRSKEARMQELAA